MQLLRAPCPASSQLAILFLLFFLLTPLNALSAATKSALNVHTASSPKAIRENKNPILPSTQPFSTQSHTNNKNNNRPPSSSSPNTTTTTTTPPYIFRLLDFHAIITSPTTEKTVLKALERTCEAFAFWLLDLDLLEEQNLILRFGDFTLDLYDVSELLNVLAVKAVVTKLLQLVAGGMLGFVRGEMVDAQAGVRLIFTFGVVGGYYGNWELRRRRVGESEVIDISDS